MNARLAEITRLAGSSRSPYNNTFAKGVMAVSTIRRRKCAADTSEFLNVTALFRWLQHSLFSCMRQLALVKNLPRPLPEKTIQKGAEPELFPPEAKICHEPPLDDSPELEQQPISPVREDLVASIWGKMSTMPAQLALIAAHSAVDQASHPGTVPPLLIKSVAPVTVYDQVTRNLWDKFKEQQEQAQRESTSDDFPELDRQTFSPMREELVTTIREEMSAMSAQLAPIAAPSDVDQADYPGSNPPPLTITIPCAPVFDHETKNLREELNQQQEPEQQHETLLRLKPVFLLPESHEKPSPPPPITFTESHEKPSLPIIPFNILAELRLVSMTDDRQDSGCDMELGWEDDPFVEEPTLPPFSLMVDPGPKKLGGPTREELNVIARTLERKLADFKVNGQIVDVLPGPVVTTFELDPAPGLRSAKVVGLADDLARSISVSSVRVVGNVPGKTVIGIEIPNEVRQTVYLKEILSSDAFRRMGSPLAVALGSDIFGNPVAGNLAKMPHLLVAGTTGSGKSVAVNAMICSILFSATPDEVRFLMVDPKMLELSIYEGIPHLLAPVVTDVHKAANLLKWAVSEMENRYRLMSELGVRNLSGFNERIAQCIENDEQPTRRVNIGMDPETGRPVEQDEPIPLDTKPLIVIVIDELADLMIQVGKEVEPAIARLAQMARAAGLHLILATQRPSVDVITGLIKANFPTRLAFQVSSKIDSRTILDAMGADRLLGMGDGLFLPPGTSHLQRIHAPFVSDKEVHDLVNYLRSTGTPDYDLSVLIQRDGDDGDEGGFMGGAGGEEQDELYDQAVRIVLRERKVSTSMVQRVFKIGYNRAARIVEQMESEGLISAPNGAGKREVLAPEG